MFLAFHEMRRAKVRFGLLTGAVGLLVFLILFQQTLLTGLVNQFIGALKNQSGEVLVYNGQARKNLEGSIILAQQAAEIAAIDGVADAAPLGEATFTVTAGGDERDTVIFGYELGRTGAPTTLIEGRLPATDNEAVASEKDRADGYDIGDVVQVLPDGVQITVVGIARDINFSVAPVLFVDFATFESAKRTRNPDATTILPSAIAIHVADGASPEAVADAINAQVEGVQALTRQQAVDGAPGVKSVRDSFRVILALFYLVVPLVTGLFFLIVTFQKASALTLLRAIGAPAKLLVRGLLVQVVIVTALGSLVAFGLYAAALQGVKNLGVHVEVATSVYTSLVVLALALVTSLVAIRRVLRIDPIAATTGAGVHL
ncbi:MAG: ABC transporter permease [Actinomycetota bacterium]|nr:ABC transporter permease [Actinomycetota bacterium]